MNNVCARVCGIDMSHKAHVELRGQPWVLVLIFCFVGVILLLFATAHTT